MKHVVVATTLLLALFCSLSLSATPSAKWPPAFSSTLDLYRRSNRQYFVARWYAPFFLLSFFLLYFLVSVFLPSPTVSLCYFFALLLSFPPCDPAAKWPPRSALPFTLLLFGLDHNLYIRPNCQYFVTQSFFLSSSYNPYTTPTY